ncbi:unnamed protein product [Aphanomyces euteiches]|uniref:Phosphatidylinositol-specific phospholipase C X domain-containing protein n=1 Tax=Aphanomyces euteiches TaxID=100861 RepID=A0A6G0X3F6_9STRA|nr:hypothetical protein Ae201684_008913 [Aphanomyces euteiches]KAH9054362.1 hypothetical protein Ae201684P_018083 [Aphanomyces euteiches]
MKIAWLVTAATALFGGFSVALDDVYSSEKIVDTVPKDVHCRKVRKCNDHNVCVIVCDRGSVEIAPWADRALALQRKLAYTHNLCHAQLPGTHNSAITIVDGYGVEDHVFESFLSYIPWMPLHLGVHTNDQLFSLTDQMRLGARLMELDVHWVDDELRIAHCGGFSSPLLDDLIIWFNKIAKILGVDIEWDSKTIGCMPSLSSIPAHSQRPVRDALEEVAAWLHHPDNKDEFLVVYFDDEPNLLLWHKVHLLLDLIKSFFPRSEILVPGDVPRGEWPSYESLLASGKRIAFLTASDYSPVGNDLLFHKSNLCDWQEPELPFEPYPACRFSDWNTSTITNDNVLFRPETSEIQYGFLNAMGHVGPNRYLIDEKLLPKLLECNVKIPSPDNITPKRMEAMIWSFAPQQPTNTTACVAMVAAHGPRWVSLDCASTKPMGAACKDGRTWHVVEHGKCPKGAEPAVPTNGYENRVLYDLLQKQPHLHGLWIPLQSAVLEAVYGESKTTQSRAHLYDPDVFDLASSS